MSWHRFFKYFRSFSTGFVVGLPVYITFTDLGLCVARVDGISMQPSLNPVGNESDIVLLNRWAVRNLHAVKRGDVVSLISPSEPDIKLIKRVIGLEGDIIKTLGYKKKYVLIPKGHCWIEGDHHGRSYDSNTFGPVSTGLISGIATRIIWPPKRWMKIGKNITNDRQPIRTFMNQPLSTSTNEEDDNEDDYNTMKEKKPKRHRKEQPITHEQAMNFFEKQTDNESDKLLEEHDNNLSYVDKESDQDLIVDDSVVEEEIEE